MATPAGGRSTANPAAGDPGTQPGVIAPPSMGGRPIQTLANLASIRPGAEMAEISHYDIAPVIDIYGNAVNTDLRSVSDRIAKIVDQQRKHLPRGSQIQIRGQVETMDSSFHPVLSAAWRSRSFWSTC